MTFEKTVSDCLPRSVEQFVLRVCILIPHSQLDIGVIMLIYSRCLKKFRPELGPF